MSADHRSHASSNRAARGKHDRDRDQRAIAKLKTLTRRDTRAAPAPAPPSPPAPEPSTSRDVCTVIQPAEQVQYFFHFRNFVSLMDVVSEEALADALREGLELGCSPLD